MNDMTQTALRPRMPLQPLSTEIWSSKYRLRADDGTNVDEELDDTFSRVARAIANVETKNKEAFYKRFREAMDLGATPAGRIMSNAGSTAHKTAVSLINCTVSDTIPDSMEGILEKVKESGLTLKAGCGIGYEFSTLRPDGAFVSGAGASTSGPLSFMDVFDVVCGTIASAGDRRGAQMATFDVIHPDTPQFVSAKRTDGRFRRFNCSLLISDEFIEAVRNGAMWVFKWNGKPFIRRDKATGQEVPAEMPALDLWNLIMRSNYDFAEPGFLLIDRINKYNNLWFCEHIRATNPCGEQPLPPYSACLLGSIGLMYFVVDPFTPNARFNFQLFYTTVRTFARMLDNVVEINGLPLPQQRAEIARKRRHGMGFYGVGTMCALMGVKYGSKESVALIEEITKQMAFANFEEGAMLAKEKGEAPVLKEVFTRADLESHQQYNANYYNAKGKKRKTKTFTGRELFLQSHYFDNWRTDPEGKRILALIEKHGCRFSHATSIAPTGTIALSFGNNASNGIEPSFSHHYTRNVIVAGRNTKQASDVFSYELLLWREMIDAEATPKVMTDEEFIALPHGVPLLDHCVKNHVLPPYFAASNDLTPEQHVDVQAASQRWIDSSISKTINVPTNTDFEKFKSIYMYAYDSGLKGCTAFRFNPEAFQGVLVTKDDLQATTYRFTLEDGSTIDVTGDTTIEYDGAQHSAANLADAIKENLYGRY